MYKKSCNFLVILALSSISSGQSPVNFTASKTTPLGYTLGAIRGAAGIIGDNYYIIESDYGSRWDFKNNIRSSLACFSIKDEKFKFRFNLNRLAATSEKEVDKILFTDIITWKDKIVGFYTYKKANASNFVASAIVCDAEGRVLKSNVEIGDFKHDYLNGSFLWQGGLLVNGRNTLSVIKDFQYRMAPDSSHIIVLCSPPQDNSGNIRLRIYDDQLTMTKEVVASLALQGKATDLKDFGIDNKGRVYLLTKTFTSKNARKRDADDDENYCELHIVDAQTNAVLKTQQLNIAPQVIINASIIIKENDQVFCFGNYFDGDNKKTRGNTVGVFSCWVNPSDFSLKKSIREIPEWVKEKFYPVTKSKKSENGLNETFEMYNTIPDGKGGLYTIMADEGYIVTVRGNTGAMNSYLETTRTYLISHVTAEKKIKWASGFLELSSNPEFQTRLDRTPFLVHNNQLYFSYVSRTLSYKALKEENGFFSNDKWIDIAPLPANYAGFKSVERTIYQLSNGEYIITVAGAQMGILRFGF